jgi:hypothetical protein
MMIWLLIVFVFADDGSFHDMMALHAASEQQCKAKQEEIAAKQITRIKAFCTIAPPLDGKIKG